MTKDFKCILEAMVGIQQISRAVKLNVTSESISAYLPYSSFGTVSTEEKLSVGALC
jgi:hypothetical protein